MLKGVAMQRFVLESSLAILQPHCSSSKGAYHVTYDMPGEKEVRIGSEQCDQQYERSDSLNYITSDMLGEER